MRATTEPLLIVGYGVWDIDGETAKRRDGSPVEFVQLLDTNTNQVRQWSLARKLDGDRPSELARATVIVNVEQVSKVSGGGENARAITKERWSVVGFVPENGTAPSSGIGRKAEPAKATAS